MEPKIISKEIIKPSITTPPNKRVLNLSLLDQLVPHMFVRLIFFYLPITNLNHISNSLTINEILKRSLSKILTYYYPFVGRVTKGDQINCNDEGIELIEAHMKCQLVDILKKPQTEEMSKLFPISGDEALDPSNINTLVIIQVTTFECGGMAIGACFSHKIADASSIATFMNDWASIVRDSKYEPFPQFDGASIFPVHDVVTISKKLICASKNCSTRRFVFDVSKIDELRNSDKGGSLKSLNPTRFETLSALICKSVLDAFTNVGLVKPSILNIAVNLRKKIVPPISENHIGNFAPHNVVKVTSGETNLYGLVALLKDGMTKYCKTFIHQNSQHERSLEIYKSYRELEELLNDRDTGMLLFSSWCRFPFYDVDFGFGKPIWASILPNPTTNCIFFCDTRDGDGIEVWISLEDQLMACFEHDKELFQFTSSNASPLDIN